MPGVLCSVLAALSRSGPSMTVPERTAPSTVGPLAAGAKLTGVKLAGVSSEEGESLMREPTRGIRSRTLLSAGDSSAAKAVTENRQAVSSAARRTAPWSELRLISV